MNIFIDTLNAWGDRAALFAAPMLLQSSLLIGVLFLLDFVLRRHARALTLYALWLLLPLKLLLPPTFTAPTSIGHWLGTEGIPSQERSPAPATVRIAAEVSGSRHRTGAEPVIGIRKLTGAAWLLLGWAAGSVALCALVCHKSRFIRRRIDSGVQAPATLTVLMETCRREMALRQPVELRLIDGSMSPSVWGWRRPVVVIPRNLVERLTEPQLRGVLLHELAHVRRGDILANALQTVLQIVYWWNPLLWFANRHIRNLREQAVDELVVVTLGDDASTYPQTLIEVARATCVRPVAAIGLLGIVESGGTLKRRLTLLLERDAPRNARLGFAQTCGIALAGALLLPMARGQQGRADQNAVAAAATPEEQTGVVVMSVWFVELPEAALTELRLGEPSVRGTNGHVAWSFNADRFGQLIQVLTNRAGVSLLAAPRVSTRSGRPARIEIVNPANSDGAATPSPVGLVGPTCVLTPELDGSHIDLRIATSITESGRLTLGPNGHWELRLPEETTPTPAQSREGPIFAVNAIGYVQYDVGTARVAVRDGGAAVLTNPTLRNNRGNRYLVLVAPRVGSPSENSNPASASQARPLPRVFAPPATNDCEVRIYRLDAEFLGQPLRAATGRAEGVQADVLVYSFLRSLGVSSHPPRAEFFNSRAKLLYLRAPRSELDRVAQAIERLESNR